MRKRKVGRPRKENKMQAVTIRMTKEIIAAIETKAGRRKFSAWLRELAEKEIKK